MSTGIYLHPFRLDKLGLWCELNIAVSTNENQQTRLKNTLQITMHDLGGYQKLIDALSVYFGMSPKTPPKLLDPPLQTFVRTKNLLYWSDSDHHHAAGSCYWDNEKFYLHLRDQEARDLVTSWYDSGYLDQLAAPQC